MVARPPETIGVGVVSVLSVREALREGIARLRDADVPSHALAAELLLMHVLGRDRTWLYSHSENVVDVAHAQTFFALIARRAAGEPTQYLTGKQEFWGLEFEVNRSVLIPRPETEHVVEVALERIGRRTRRIDVDAKEMRGRLRIADVGTGSGCIAVALARELTDAEIFATDISGEALGVARRNAGRHDVAERVHFVRCDLLEAFARTGTAQYGPQGRPMPADDDAADSGFDVIVSNPPYVRSDRAETLAREIREHEPHVALFGGATGTDVYARLIEQAAGLLRRGGVLVLELGYDSAPPVQGLLAGDPAWTAIEITNDLAGMPRVIAAQIL